MKIFSNHFRFTISSTDAFDAIFAACADTLIKHAKFCSESHNIIQRLPARFKLDQMLLTV